MMIENPQDFLWHIPATFGPWWWLICSAFSLLGAFLCFLYLIMNHQFTAVVFGRILMCGGLFALGLVPLNWGWLPWAAMLLSVGGGYTYFLIATGWCERTDKRAIIREWLTWVRHPHENKRSGLGSSD